MLVVELGVKCKTRNCKGAPSIGVITVESPQALNEWMKGFRRQDINRPICKQTAVYSQSDLQVSLVRVGVYASEKGTTPLGVSAIAIALGQRRCLFALIPTIR